MRKVNNKEVVHRLSDRSFKVNKTRNRIAVLAIALTTILFTALFSVTIGATHTLQMQTARQSGSDAHGVFKDLTQEQYDTLKTHPLIKESMRCILAADYVRNAEFLKRHMEIWYYPEQAFPRSFIEIIKGKRPEKADEILLDETSMELLGQKLEPGQKVTLQLQIRQYDETIVERTFTVTGITKADPAFHVGFAIVSEAYLEKYAEELKFDGIRDNGSKAGAIRMDVMLSNSFNIQKKLDQVVTESEYSKEAVSEKFIDSNANWAYISDGADPMTIGAVVGAMALILLTGYLIIYNIFRISIMKDIRYYGLLKTIGTTGRQIKKMIRRQAFKLSVIGIPIGLIIGFFVGKGMLPLIMNTLQIDNQYSKVPLNPFIFIGAGVFAMMTVFISTGHPAKLAAKVSPIEALRYTEGCKAKKKGKRSSNGGKIFRMAFFNLGRSTGKTMIIIISLSLAVILLNSVFTITNSFDIDLYLSSFTNADFLIGNAKYFNYNYRGDNETTLNEENLTESFISACESQEGFEDGGRIYAAGGIVGVKKEGIILPEYYSTDDEGNIGYYHQSQFVSLYENEHGDYATTIYGVDDFVVGEMKVWKGETDLKIIEEKLATGDYVVYAAPVDDNRKVQDTMVMHETGDKVTLTYTDKNGTYQERVVTVLSVIKKDYWNLTTRNSAEFPYYISANVFKEMLSDKYLMTYSFNAADDQEKNIDLFLKQYTDQAEPLMNYNSKLQYISEFSTMTGMFVMIGGSLAFVIGLIGILNFINSILTGIITRQREFAMMQAIGMTRRQLTKLVIIEGLYYAVLTIGFSLAAGCLFSLTAVRVLSGGMWFMRYQFTLIPMMIVFPILLLLGVFIPYMAFRFGNAGSVVEELQKVE